MVRIIMMQPPSFMPNEMADLDGFYSLDLNDNDRIALTRRIDDYINIGTIKQDTFKELTLPITKKNRLLFGNIGNPSALNENNNKIFDIQLLKGDFSYPVQGLQIVGNNEDENQYNAIIFGELNDWYRPMSNLFLNELELGSAVVDANFIFNDNHQTNYIYDDTNYPVFAPMCNYGDWFINHNIVSNANSQVVFNNFRFWYSVLALIRQAFCQVGYELVAPILETEYFRRVWVYLLDPNFETANQADVANRPFEYTNNIDQPLNLYNNIGAATFFNVITDPGNHVFQATKPTYAYTGTMFSGGVIGVFSTSGVIKFQNPLPVILLSTPAEYFRITVSIYKSDKFGIQSVTGPESGLDLLNYTTILAEETIERTNPIGPGIIVPFAWDFSTLDSKTYQHEIVYVRFVVEAFLVNPGTGVTYDDTWARQASYFESGGIFKLDVNKQVIEEGDTLDWGLMLRQDLTAIDLMKGVSHIPNLKLETDTINKKVYMYPEFKFNLFNDGIQEAYFKDNNDDTFEATNLIQVKSLEQAFKNTELKREVYLKFINSTDGYIQKQNLEQELHSKKFDLGDEYIEGTNEITNPFFEPLDTGIDANLSFAINQVGFAPNSVNLIPFMWEGQPSSEFEYPSIGFDYTPRIAIAYEIANHIETPPSVSGQLLTGFSWFVYEDQARSFYNLFGQIFEDGVMIQNISDPLYQANLAIVYGNGINPNIDDFFKLVYNKSINQAYFNIALSFLVMLDLASFSNLSFRRKWHLKYRSAAWGEIDIYCRLGAAIDYVIGENIVTPVELVPDNNNFTHC